MNFSFEARRAGFASTRGAKLPPLTRCALTLAAAVALAGAAHSQVAQPAAPVTKTKLQKQPNAAAAGVVSGGAKPAANKPIAPTAARPAQNAKPAQNATAAQNAIRKTASPASVVKSDSSAQKPAEKKIAAQNAAPSPSASTREAAKSSAGAATAQRPFRAAPFLSLSSLSQRTLPNGVRALVQETRGTGIVSVQVWVRAGSRYETNAEAGAAHIVETIALRSSRYYSESSDGPRGALEALGAAVSSQATRDSVSYSVSVAPRFVGAAMRILVDAVLHPRLQENEVEAAKGEVGLAISRRPFNGLDAATLDLGNAEDIAYGAAFSRHPYRRSPRGTLQSVLAINASRVRAFHARRYVGKNISVVVAGEIGEAQAHGLLAKSFADAKTSAAETPIATETKAPAPRTITRRGFSPRPTTVLAYRSPSISQADDVIAMDVLLAYLGEGREASLRRLLLGEPVEENAPLAPASTRSAPAENAPERQAMPATMLEDRSPHAGDAPSESTSAQTATAPVVSQTPQSSEPTLAPGATAEQNTASSGGATPQSSAEANAASDANANATASTPDAPAPPTVFLPKIGADSRDAPGIWLRDRALATVAGRARVLAPRAWLIQDAAPIPAPTPNAAPTPTPNANPAALAFDTAFLTQRDAGIVAFSLVTENANRARAMKIVQDELRRVRASGISQADLARAKSVLIRQYLRQGETPTGRAGALGFYEMISTYAFATTYIERIQRLKVADIKRVAARYFPAKPLVTVFIESPPQPAAPAGEPRDDGGVVA